MRLDNERSPAGADPGVTNDPPFHPPYKTFEEGPDGERVTETKADGATRLVPVQEAARLTRLWRSLELGSAPPKVGSSTTSGSPKRSIQPQTQGNDRAVIFLNVPFAEKDEAKRLGAKWDGAARKWYVLHGIDVNLFTRWWPDSLTKETKPFD